MTTRPSRGRPPHATPGQSAALPEPVPPPLKIFKLYNLVYDRAVIEGDFAKLRAIHVEIDEAVREAYALDEEREPQIREFEAKIASAPLPSWQEIDLGHGFHETRQGVRFTISPQARTDVPDKLLA